MTGSNGIPVAKAAMLVFALIAMLASPASAHEGHDHGAPPPPVSTTIAPRTDASSTDLELVAIARGDRLRIYLDTFRGNVPVNDAVIEIDGPEGMMEATAAGEGVYEAPAPWLARPGAHDLAFTIQTPDLVDVLTATLTIPEKAPAVTTVSSGPFSILVSSAFAQDIRERIREGDAGLWIVGGVAFLAGLFVAGFLRRRSAAASVLVAAALSLQAVDARAASTAPAVAVAERDVAQRFADGALFVPKTTQRILALRTLFTEVSKHPGSIELPARVIPDPALSGYVQASVAGRLMPPPEGFPRLGARVAAGQVLALVEPALSAADATSQQQQARELDQEIALIERRLERFRQIEGAVTRSQVEDAELELDGLRRRRADLESAPREPERLVAPVPGVIAAAQAIAGQVADPGAVLFQIVDPSRYWVEALSFEAHLIGTEADGRLADGSTVRLAYRGSGLADRNQAIPIHFSIEGSAEGVRAGQLLMVHAVTQSERSGIAVPRASVLRAANGQSIVYEHSNAERFVPREVRVEPLDGDRVLIVSGIEAGRRIVTQGAELLNQIR